jgi:hypothetical protein
MPPKVSGFSKSAAAKEAKAAAKEAAAGASAKAAEDEYWKEAGDGAKSKSAAKKDEQVRRWRARKVTARRPCGIAYPFFNHTIHRPHHL